MKKLLLIFSLLLISLFFTKNTNAIGLDHLQEVDECQGECITYETETYCSNWFWWWCTDWDEREVCTEYENLCIEPSITPSPEPTDAPKEDVEDGDFSDTSNPPIACTATAPEKLPWDIHVVRNGSDATVKAFIPEGDKVNVYYRSNSSLVWEHALGDVPVIDDGQRRVEVTIHDLVPSIGYTFGVQAVNACTGGEIVGVVIDPPSNGAVFNFSHWELL